MVRHKAGPTRPRKPSQHSPGRGGPGTFGGISFQVDVAVLFALREIEEEQWAPHRGATLSLEPRLVDSTGQVGFDLEIQPQGSYVEVKLAPRRQDVLCWLRAVASSAAGQPNARFILVHARGGAAVSDLSELRRCAQEARDSEHFAHLVANTLDDGQREMLAVFSDDAWKVTRRIEVLHQPEHEVRDEIVRRARWLFVNDAAAVLDLLTDEFVHAAPDRKSYRIRELIETVRRRGYSVHTPPPIQVPDLDRTVASALVILQACDRPLPTLVVACATGVPVHDLVKKLTPYMDKDLVTLEAGCLRLGSFPSELTSARRADLMASTLRALLHWARDKNQRETAVAHLRTVWRLSEQCLAVDPDLVAFVFPAMDKLLKATGDLHLILEVAKLSVRAASMSWSPGQYPTPEMLKWKAQTWICGISWVYQRTEHLSRAREYAEKSLQLGEQLGWKRNTAFCHKCIGRLLRLEAEAVDSGNPPKTLLEESIRSLQVAIPVFESLTDEPDLGLDCEDVGECYSLIGRTYLVAGESRQAQHAIDRAYEILQRFRGSKAWADLTILDGELGLHLGHREMAVDRAEQVLEHLAGHGAEVSEIRARAWHLRASAREILGAHDLAINDLSRAADEYEKLRDTRRASTLRWKELQLRNRVRRGAIPSEIVTLLRKEPDAAVCVETVRLYSERIKNRSGGRVRGRRTGAPIAQLKALLEDARLEARRKEVEWE